MTHKLRLPFISDDPANLNDGRKGIFVSRLASIGPGVFGMQGRPVGSQDSAPRTWRASEYDIANLLYAYAVGYRGMLHLPCQGDVWAELAAKINNDGRRA